LYSILTWSFPQLGLNLNRTPHLDSPWLGLSLTWPTYLDIFLGSDSMYLPSNLDSSSWYLILTFPCLCKPSPEAQESSLNLPGQLTHIAYPIDLPRIIRALPKCLTHPPYPDSTWVLTRALREHLTRSCTPFPALPDCLARLGNSLPALSKVFYLSR
jgi:hypothetical protein